MSKAGASGELRPLPVLHGLTMLALGILWAFYCWRQSPLRGVGPRGRPRDEILGLDQALDILTASVGDVLLGLCTLLLFAVGTGIYVRRFQVWLDARSSGEAVAYGSADLKDQALSANLPQARRP